MTAFFKRKLKEEQKKKVKAEKKMKEPSLNVEELLTIALANTEEKKEEAVVEIEETPAPEPVAEIPKVFHKAQNSFYDSKLKKFVLVTIDYDVDSSYARIVDVKPFADSSAEAAGKLSNIITLKLFRGEERK